MSQGDMRRLGVLLGQWIGEGRGDFPSIAAFRYVEELSFVANGVDPLIRYEQRTWLAAGDAPSSRIEPSHWEVGFVIPTGNRGVEISNAQNGGRVEVLAGELVTASSPEVLRIELNSVALAHDDRLLETRRVIEVAGEVLRYSVDMATRDHPELQRHLSAKLRRRHETQMTSG